MDVYKKNIVVTKFSLGLFLTACVILSILLMLILAGNSFIVFDPKENVLSLGMLIIPIYFIFFIPEYGTHSDINSYKDGFTRSVALGINNYFDFESRSNRSQFWWFILWIIIGDLLFIFYDLLLFSLAFDEVGPFEFMWSIVTLIPILSSGARRLHDTGRSGWWQLLYITVIGIIPLIYFLTRPSKKVTTLETINKTIKDLSNNQSTSSSNTKSLSSELDRISQMHKDGTLSDEEFKKAKEKLLN